jgi:hypothetical protein
MEVADYLLVGCPVALVGAVGLWIWFVGVALFDNARAGRWRDAATQSENRVLVAEVFGSNRSDIASKSIARH